MSIKFGSVVLLILVMFFVKLSIDNVQTAQAGDRLPANSKSFE